MRFLRQKFSKTGRKWSFLSFMGNGNMTCILFFVWNYIRIKLFSAFFFVQVFFSIFLCFWFKKDLVLSFWLNPSWLVISWKFVSKEPLSYENCLCRKIILKYKLLIGHHSSYLHHGSKVTLCSLLFGFFWFTNRKSYKP